MSGYKPKYKKEVEGYVDDIVSGKDKGASKYVKLACERYLKELERTDLIQNYQIADWAIDEAQTLVHVKGPLRGEFFKLEPWQKFIFYYIFLFYWRSSGLRKIREVLIYMGRKNGKSLLAASIIWVTSLLYKHEGSNALMVSASLKQIKDAVVGPLEARVLKNYGMFDDKLQAAKRDGWRIATRSNNDTSITHDNVDGDGGSVKFAAFATNPKAHDSFGGNVLYLDECHEMPVEEFEVMQGAAIAYPSHLILMTSTAGLDASHFFKHYVDDRKQDLEAGKNDDKPILEDILAFICEPDIDKDGNVNFLDADQMKKANPNMGVTFNAEDIISEAQKAEGNSFKRANFLAKRMNIYVNSTKSSFDIELFEKSDRQFNWTINDLRNANINWIGAIDLSKVNDLTAVGLYGTLPNVKYDDGTIRDVDVYINHVFFPRNEAYRKSKEDNIPIFKWQEEGALTICEGNTINYNDVFRWFLYMRDRLGFKITAIGYDEKFMKTSNLIYQMQDAGFVMLNQPQYGWVLTPGVFHIQRKAYDGEFYYLHNSAYEYCLQNAHAREISSQAVQIEKIAPNKRIDAFMASVFAANKMLDVKNSIRQAGQVQKWWS